MTIELDSAPSPGQATTSAVRRRRTNRWYGAEFFPSGGAWFAANGFTNNEMQAWPYLVTERQGVDRAGLECTVVGSAGAVWRIGLYADNGDGLPTGNPLFDTTVDMTTGTGFLMSAVFPVVNLDPGLYWLVDGLQGAPATKPTVRYAQPWLTQFGTGSSDGLISTSGGAPGSGPYIITAAGALPAWAGTAQGAAYGRPVMLRKANPT